MKKKKIDEDNFEKKYYKKRKQKRNWKKNHVMKNLYLLVIVILNQLNI